MVCINEQEISVVVAIIRPVTIDGKISNVVVEHQVTVKAVGGDGVERVDGLAVETS